MRITTVHAACAVRSCLVSTVTLVAVIACASTHAVSGVGSLRAAPPAIEVTNDRYDYVVVYLIHSGLRVELGVVPATSRRTFTPTSSQLGTDPLVALGAGPRGAAMDQVSIPLALRPGSNARWTLRERWIEQPVVR